MVELNREFLKFAIEKWGIPAQLGMIVEEASEFNIPYIKWLFRSRGKERYWEEMEEEFADLLLVMEEAKEIFDMKKVEDIMKDKVMRLYGRMVDDGFEPPNPFLVRHE